MQNTSPDVGGRGLKNADIFMAFNVVLFIFMCIFVYYDRFISYRGRENIIEFFLYAVLITATVFAAWLALRRYTFRSWLLVLIEVGILMHFAGGLVQLHGSRLYDSVFFGLRYDKYVHFTNSFFGTLIVKDFFDRRKMKLYDFESLAVVLIVLGFGAVIEIVEFVVTKTVTHNGVGDYDNNMVDLISNLAGGLLYMLIARLRTVLAGLAEGVDACPGKR